MRVKRQIFTASVGLALAACASAPTHYYTLLAPPHDRNGAAQPDAPYLVDVLPIDIPAQVDQPQLVVRQGTEGIAMLDHERWAAPLNDELRAALSAELVERLGAQDVAGIVSPIGKPVLRIKMEVRRFESVPGQYALIDADWSMGIAGDPAGKRLLCRSRLRETVAGDDDASLVRSHQQAIAALAAQMATAAPGWFTSRRSVCPIQETDR
ncbi:PqiC family protein [Dyella sp. Tek66A03]|uniref:PqiC family protein n=1 Tax=Dyella sp. Tek66A03 TaxID=3458298 RepID=UPI00403E7C6F